MKPTAEKTQETDEKISIGFDFAKKTGKKLLAAASGFFSQKYIFF